MVELIIESVDNWGRALFAIAHAHSCIKCLFETLPLGWEYSRRILLNRSANIISKEAVALPSLADEPNQPSSFPFQKRLFGKTKPVLCANKPQWFKSWKFLHYDEAHCFLSGRSLVEKIIHEADRTTWNRVEPACQIPALQCWGGGVVVAPVSVEVLMCVRWLEICY